MYKPMDDDSTANNIIDDFTEEEHAAMDAKTANWSKEIETFMALGMDIDSLIVSSVGHTILLHAITSCEKMNQSFLITNTEKGVTLLTLLKQPDVAKAVRIAVENRSLRPLRCLKSLRTPERPPIVSNRLSLVGSQAWATQSSWKLPFKGHAHEVLLRTIINGLNEVEMNAAYAPSAFVSNSSGTGKSKLVDQLSELVVSIPICLRPGHSTGYPLGDDAFRNWYMEPQHLGSRSAGARASNALVYAILKVLHSCLREIEHATTEASNYNSILNKADEHTSTVHPTKTPLERQQMLARLFKERMALGQTYVTHGDYRKDFYKMAVAEAEQYMQRSYPGKDRFTSLHESSGDLNSMYSLQRSENDNVRAIAKQVTSFLAGHSNRRRPNEPPLIIISFDEAEALIQGPEAASWTLYSELQHVLHQLKYSQIFCLFLSTTTECNLFSTESSLNQSARIVSYVHRSLAPITEIGLDQLASPAIARKTTLEDVTSLSFIAHLGRPLFGSRYDYGDREVRGSLVDFARAKLLGGQSNIQPDMERRDREGVLAAIAVRCPIEFSPQTEREKDVLRRQVEWHMRIVLAATSRFEYLTTIAASEPILAEAASFVKPEEGLAFYLGHHMDRSGVSVGDRGEFVAMLTLLAARDAASAASRERMITVHSFLEALIPESSHDGLRNAHPTNVQYDEEDVPLKDAFKESWMWFNHFIKVDDLAAIHVDHLWALMSRGAAILCANNQGGIDIITQFTNKGTVLAPENISVMLYQVKNSPSFDATVVPAIFAIMDPMRLKIFDGNSAHPVVRIVMSLAAPEPEIIFVKPPTRRSEHPRTKRELKNFTSYDIWFAGISPETYRPMSASDAPHYRALLQRSQGLSGAYDLFDDWIKHDAHSREGRSELRRRMNPGTAVNEAHWSFIQRNPEYEDKSSMDHQQI